MKASSNISDKEIAERMPNTQKNVGKGKMQSRSLAIQDEHSKDPGILHTNSTELSGSLHRNPHFNKGPQPLAA